MNKNKNGKIFSADGEYELNNSEIDLTLGRLEPYTEVIIHGAIEAQEEEGHYVVLHTYENGGQDVEWIVDKERREAQPEWEETVVYHRYIPYSEEEIRRRHNLYQIEETKKKLQESDFKLLKYLEGHYTEEEYQPIKEKREEYRKFIRDLEKDNEKIEKQLEQERNK